MNNSKDLENVLLKHYKLYPESQIQDMIKLIYQNEFGGGHLVLNETQSLYRINEEYRRLDEYSSPHCSDSPCEDIGNNLYRLNLRVLKNSDINSSTINRFFVNTANSAKGSLISFENKLGIFRECCANGKLPYPVHEADSYISNYKENGYPPVGHSDTYRQLYKPSYRIVKKPYCMFLKVFSEIDRLMKLKATVNVAIDGKSGAGKSTLANLLQSVYDCNVFHMDDYFLRPELKTEERLRETGGNVDYTRFYDEVICGIRSGKSFSYQVYDCKTQSLEETIIVSPRKLNVIEGSYSMHPTLRELYDLKVFLTLDEKAQEERILERNGPVMARRFIEEWIPKENRYFDKFKIARLCDLVYDVTSF